MICFQRFRGYKDKDIFELKIWLLWLHDMRKIWLLHEDMFPQLKGYLQQTWSKNISKEDHGQISYPHQIATNKITEMPIFLQQSLTYFWNTNFQK